MKIQHFFWCLLFFVGCQSAEQQPDVNTDTVEPVAATFINNAVSDYQEQHRPQYHFTPDSMWMNDPNGMVYFEGEYHLFYQHYPDDNVWGPMHWGHAVSTDLVRWEHLPIALYPDSLGLIFSGSAVVDWKNTSGFGQDDEPPLIAIFTHHLMEGEKAGRNDFQYQSIAYSTDKGRTWTKYAGNPVIPNTDKIRDFRDPKVIWDEDSEQWVMVFAAQDRVRLYGSPNLKDWTFLSEFGEKLGAHGGVWECPDLFPMTIAETGERKWVLLQSINPGSPNGGSGTQYFIGDFDGKSFIPDADFAKDDTGIWLDYGRDNYAGVTWSDIPQTDGRRLFMGWMSNWDYATIVPTTRWRSATTLARTLALKNTPAGLRLLSQPVAELEQLRAKKYSVTDLKLNDTSINLTDRMDFSPTLSEVILEAEVAENATLQLELSNGKGEKYLVGYDAAQQQFFSDRQQAGKQSFSEKFAADIHTAPRMSANKKVRLHVFFDTASAELFADNGAVVITDIFFPNEPFSQLHVTTNGGAVTVTSLDVYQINPNQPQLLSEK